MPLLFSGCTIRAAIQTPEPTAFIQSPELLERPKYTPFSLAWISQEIPNREYTTVIVSAVRSDMVDSANWINSSSTFLRSRESYVDRLHDLAEYTQSAVQKALVKFDSKPEDTMVTSGIAFEPAVAALPIPTPTSFPLEAEPRLDSLASHENSLEIQISIAEVCFGDPVLYGGLLFVPVPAAANLSTAARSASLTLEARFIDGNSNVAVGELIDRRFPRIKAIDLNRLTVDSAVHEMADSFAEDLVRSIYRKEKQKVKGHFPFTLIPW